MQYRAFHETIISALIRSNTMTRKTKTNAAIALLLMALLLAGCNPSADGPGSSDDPPIAIMKAVSQAMASVSTGPESSHVTQNGSTYKVTSFTADDGSRIDGTFTTGANGEIIDANLKFYYADGTEGPTFILKTENDNTTSVTLDGEPVNPSVLPQPMTRDQARAFGAFLMGFEEALEDVEDAFDDILDDDLYRTEGTHQIRDNGWGITGTVQVAPEDRWDDDMEIIAADISFPAIPLDRGASVKGSYSFTSRGDDNIDADLDITIEGYSESDDGIFITLNDVRIKASIAEGERRDDDYFTFDGSISGSFTLGRGASDSHSIKFAGRISALEDHYFRFPEYSLTIDGQSVAIGRQERSARI